MRVMKHKKTSLAVAAALALGAGAAQAEIGMKAGAWDLSFSGNVNGFLTRNSCDNSTATVNGGLACNNAGGLKEVAVESGLLPSALVFSGKSTQSGWDIGVTLGFYPGLNGSALGPGKQGLDSTAIDMRQNFLTFGTKAGGTVKVGRDIGMFGSDAILADMTLLGVGSGGGFGGGNTTLGRIGVGYIYTDWIPQISYTSPKHGAFQYSAGVFQGMDIVPAGAATSASLTAHEQPGLQAKGSYEWTGTVGGKAWVSGLSQKVKSRGAPTDTAPAGSSLSGQAFDLGAKLNVADFEGVLYAYSADGIGTEAIGFNAAAVVGGNLEKRKSKGGYVQGTYRIGKLKPGVSYGESSLDLASNETNPNLVKKNKSAVLGLYYSLTQSLNLVGEYIKTTAQNQAGGENKDSVIALGAILFF